MDCTDLARNGTATNDSVQSLSYIDRFGVRVTYKAQCTGEGWTVVQSRGQFGNDPLMFKKKWTEYEQGFGTPGEEYWLGLRHLHELTRQGNYLVRFEMQAWDGDIAEAFYSGFKVAGPGVS